MRRALISRLRARGWAVAIVLVLCGSAVGQSPYQWSAGPSSDPNIFPISIWYQAYMSSRLSEWTGIGVNQYVTPTAPNSSAQTLLRNYRVDAMITYNSSYRGSDVVNGWLQPDEPDNAQWNSATQTYDPCIDPAIIIAQYNTWKAADPNRPVILGLGQGVCWPWDRPYYGRGSGSTWAQYEQYVQGGDIIAFDVYPYNERTTDAPYRKPWYIAIGIDRLKAWTNNSKPIWMTIETVDINGSGTPPKAYQTKGEVWMALIHGVSGIQYFAQTWKPDGSFNREDTVFSSDPNYVDPNMAGMLKVLNAQIQHYSKVLYSPVVKGQLDANLPVNWVQKQYGSMTYVFAVSMWDDPNVKTTTFSLSGLFPGTIEANVMDEGRKVTVTNGTFTDDFSSLSVHIYEIPVPEPASAAILAGGAAWFLRRRRRR